MLLFASAMPASTGGKMFGVSATFEMLEKDIIASLEWGDLTSAPEIFTSELTCSENSILTLEPNSFLESALYKWLTVAQYYPKCDRTIFCFRKRLLVRNSARLRYDKTPLKVQVYTNKTKSASHVNKSKRTMTITVQKSKSTTVFDSNGWNIAVGASFGIKGACLSASEGIHRESGDSITESGSHDILRPCPPLSECTFETWSYRIKVTGLCQSMPYFECHGEVDPCADGYKPPCNQISDFADQYCKRGIKKCFFDTPVQRPDATQATSQVFRVISLRKATGKVDGDWCVLEDGGFFDTQEKTYWNEENRSQEAPANLDGCLKALEEEKQKTELSTRQKEDRKKHDASENFVTHNVNILDRVEDINCQGSEIWLKIEGSWLQIDTKAEMTRSKIFMDKCREAFMKTTKSKSDRRPPDQDIQLDYSPVNDDDQPVDGDQTYYYNEQPFYNDELYNHDSANDYDRDELNPGVDYHNQADQSQDFDRDNYGYQDEYDAENGYDDEHNRYSLDDYVGDDYYRVDTHLDLDDETVDSNYQADQYSDDDSSS